MNTPNFTDLMREVNAISDPNAKQLLLYEARAIYKPEFRLRKNKKRLHN